MIPKLLLKLRQPQRIDYHVQLSLPVLRSVMRYWTLSDHLEYRETNASALDSHVQRALYSLSANLPQPPVAMEELKECILIDQVWYTV